MSSAELQTAIFEKYNTEETTGTVLYYGRAVKDAVKPYIVMNFLPDSDASTFRTYIREEEIQFNIIDKKLIPTNLYAIKKDLITIFHNKILTVTNYKDVTLDNNLNVGPIPAGDSDNDMQIVVTFEGKAQGD